MVHDNCTCREYTPDFKETGIRYSGNVFYCIGCHAYVDGTKWKGGIVSFGNRTRLLKYFECPCCGERMRSKCRGKNKLQKSIDRQLENPLGLQPHLMKQLPMKVQILQKIIHTHTLHE